MHSRGQLKCDTHAQKPDFVFRRNGWVHLNRRSRQFSRLLAAELCASAVVMLDTPCSEVVWRVLATHSIRQFPLHFPSLASPCAITFQMESNNQRHQIVNFKLPVVTVGKLLAAAQGNTLPRTNRSFCIPNRQPFLTVTLQCDHNREQPHNNTNSPTKTKVNNPSVVTQFTGVLISP